MAAGGKNIELKVGALILVSLLLLGGFIVVMGGLSFARVETLYVDFDNPNGLQIGAPVRIAGVKVGKVEDLEYLGGKKDNDPQVTWRALVRVKISVETKVKDSIHDDAQFVITTQGVLGEPFIAILPGNPDHPVMPDGAKRLGQDPPRLDVFLAEASDLMHLAHEAFTKPGGPLQDLAVHGASLIKGLDILVSDNSDTIKRIMQNTEQLSKEGIELLDATKEKIDGPEIKRILHNIDVTTSVLARDTGPAIHDARSAIAHLDSLTITANDAAKDLLSPDQRAHVKKSLEQLEAVAVAANKTTADVQEIVHHIKSGEGTIGAFVMDEEIYDDLQEMLRDLKHNPWKLFGVSNDAAVDDAQPEEKRAIRTRTLGKSGLVVSELALGTFGLAGDAYGEVSEAEMEKTIARARELGVTLFETADSYGARGGDPHAERFEKRLGRWLDGDADARVCTKGGNDLDAAPPRKRFDRAFVRASAERSAERLRRAPDLYLLHHPTPTTVRNGEATEALQSLVKEKVIGAWGVACGDAEVARAAVEMGASVIELAYNVLASEDLHAITGEVLESNVGLLARSPLAYGLLCGTWSPEKSFAEGDHRRDRWRAEELRARLVQVAALRPLVHDDVHTVRSVALRYVLSNQVVGALVVGVRSAAQLEANVRAIGNGPPYLPEKDLSKIGELVDAKA